MKTKNLFLAAALFILLAVGGPVPSYAEDATVTIEDPYLNKVVLSALNKTEGDSITKEEMLSITELSSDSLPYVESPAEDLKEHNRGIESLEGLQYAENLESLDLSENRISDLSPLSGLDKLTYLEVDRNNIRDLTPLADLTGLEHLNIYNNFLESIEPLRGLENLQFLDMHFANREGTVIDHSPLSSLTSLNYLSVESNHLTNIDFLQPLVDSGNLETILVRANAITDFSVLSDMLYREYQEMYPSGMPGFEEAQETSIMVGTNNQNPLSEPLEIEASSEGGEVRVALPKFTGFEKVEEYYAGFAAMMEMDLWQISLENTEDGVDAYYDSATNEAVFTFDPNVVGTPIDFSTRLILGIWGTDFEAQLPIHVTQPADFDFEMNIEDGSEQILFIDTDNEEYVSSNDVTGTITGPNGEAPELKDVKISFTGTCEWRNSISQDIFSAEDIRIDGNTFRFKVKQDKERSAEGNFILNPTIEFRVEGSDDTYTLERGAFKIYNVYVDSDAITAMDDRLTFDVAQFQGVNYTSTPFNLQFEKNARPIEAVTVDGSDGIRQHVVISEDKSTFTVETDKQGLKNRYTVQIMLESRGYNEAPLHLSAAEPKLIYSAESAEIEEQLTLSPLSLKKGEEAEMELRYQGTVLDEYSASAGNADILDVSGNLMIGVSPGTGTVEITDLIIPYAVEGEEMNVTYVPGKTFDVSVSNADGQPTAEDPDTTDTPKGSEETEDASVVQTGDASDVFFWSLIGISTMVMLLVSGMLRYGFRKK